MKKITGIIVTILVYLLLSSCQQIFTYSPLTFAQRDPADLPPEQQVAYAESALASGDVDAIISAYEAIANSDDPDINLLASELAFAGSGVSDAIEEATALLDGGSGDFLDLLVGLDGDLLQGSADEFESALVGGATPTEEQFVNAAVSLVLVELQDPVADIDSVIADLTTVADSVTPPTVDDVFDPTWTPVEQSYYYVLQAGFTDITDFESSFSL
jgi:hypothetical protein